MTELKHEASLRARFHELNAEKERVLADAQPLQDQYDSLRAKMDEITVALEPVRAALIEAKKPLYDIDMERAALARALQGKTGEPD